MKYNYIYFNSGTRNEKNRNKEYYVICLQDLAGLDSVQIINYPLEKQNVFLKKLFELHHSQKINRRIKLPFKKVWYPLYFREQFNDDKPICFIISSSFANYDYIQYLKSQYPKAKFVKIFRDLYSVWADRNPEFKTIDISTYFDLLMSIDENECKKYNMVHFDEIGSKVFVPTSKEYPLYDVFFAGKAKDRIEKLKLAYKKMTSAGLKCFFYITDTPEEYINSDGIIYAKKQMTYDEMLYYTVNSKCVLEINQEGAVGYTSRFIEAVTYNVRLITDNPSVMNTRFYDTGFIQYIHSVDEIDTSFVLDKTPVEFAYNNEFSPIKLIKKMDALL